MDVYRRRAFAVSQWVLAALAVLFCLHGEQARFSHSMVLFGVYFLWDLWYSRRHGLPLWPRLNEGARIQSAAILLFYLVLIADGILLLDWNSMDTGVRLGRLALPFFMMIYIEGKYPGGRGFAWGAGAGLALLGLTGIVLGEGGAVAARYEGIFKHPNTFGLMLMLVIPMGLYQLSQGKHPAFRLFLAAGLVLCAFCFYMTDSRASMGGLVGGALAAIATTYWLHRRRMTGKGKKLAAAAVAVILIAGGGVLWDMQSHRTGAGLWGWERPLMWQASYEMWQDHKLLGIGLDNWKETYYSPQYHPEGAREADLGMAHNMPIHFLATTGILGGGAFLLFLGASFLALRKRAKETNDTALSILLFTLYFEFILTGLLDSTYINKSGGLLYYAFLGYGIMKEKNNS